MDEFIANQTVDIRMQTDLGGIDIRLRGDVAPITVENFCRYIDSGDYDGTFFHRNITGFVAQAGGFKFNPDDGTFFGGGKSEIPENDPIINEAGLPGALSNIAGTLAMAKLPGDPNSATSQWFFNVADNSGEPPLGLDFQNGGFTAFAQVLGDDIAVVEDINAQDICQDIPGLGTVVCGENATTIQIGASRPVGLGFVTDNLLVVNYVGLDSDGDGIVDGVEAGAPDTDVDLDGTLDVNQANIASFDNVTGEYVTLQSADGTALKSTDVLSPAYAIAHPPSSFCFFKDLDFTGGFAGTEITGVTPGGATIVDVTLPVGVLPDTFYSYGPTPGQPEPHWYEFLYNGETGAQISGNTVRLHFVEGKRGDNDANSTNGVITNVSGPAFTRTVPREEDGILGFVEDNHPNEGDGNDDGIPDSTQAHVVSFTDLHGDYVTIETNSAGSLNSAPVKLLNNNAPLPRDGSVAVLAGQNLAHGFFSFEMCAETGTATVILPEGEKPKSYFMFGPTPNNPEPHYYEFMFDPATGTGAVINGNVITLHFIDGERGDSDLDGTNGVISDPGGPTFPSLNTGGDGGGGGGGCTLTRNNVPGPEHAGAWWLLLLLVSLAGMRRVRRKVGQ